MLIMFLNNFRHEGPTKSMTCKVAGWGLTKYPNGTLEDIPDILQDGFKLNRLIPRFYENIK